MSFIHLHVHDSHSILGGLGKPEQYAEIASGMGHSAVALTNTANLFMVHKFQQACKKFKLKPIHGVEFYMAESDDLRRQDSGHQFRLLVLAKNQAGWDNLMKLSTLSFFEGNYYVPRIDNAALMAHSEGLIVLCGGMESSMASVWGKGDEGGALEIARKYRDKFGDDFYLEILPYELFSQVDFNKFLVGISKLDGFNLVATNGVRYPTYDLADYYQFLLMIGSHATVNTASRMKEFSRRMYFASRERMVEWFRAQEFDGALVDGWLNRTVEVANKIEPLEFKAGFKLPRFEQGDVDVDVPEGSFYEQDDEEDDGVETPDLFSAVKAEA